MHIPGPSRQIAFHQLLVAARKTWLSDALAAALDSVDIRDVKRELDGLVPTDVQRILSRAGIRDEYVFPCPSLLETSPERRRSPSTPQAAAWAGSRSWRRMVPCLNRCGQPYRSCARCSPIRSQSSFAKSLLRSPRVTSLNCPS